MADSVDTTNPSITRQVVETQIDLLIDQLDADPDVEPSLGFSTGGQDPERHTQEGDAHHMYWDAGHDHEDEHDGTEPDVDAEYSLGWGTGYSQTGQWTIVTDLEEGRRRGAEEAAGVKDRWQGASRMRGVAMTRCFPRHTRDTTAVEAVMDLEEGVGILIEHLEAVVESFSETEYGTDIVQEVSPVFWIALRLQNDMADVLRKVEALHHPVVAEAAE